LLNVVAQAFEWLRWAGAVYLVFLGIKQWRSANDPLEIETSSVSKKNLLFTTSRYHNMYPKSLIL